MQYFKNWLKEKDNNKLIKDINYKIKSLYMNNEIKEVHEIFNSQWNQYIDLSYDNGSILEFAGLLKEFKEPGKALKEIKFLIDYIEQSKDSTTINTNKEKYYNAIHNILLTAINFNKKDILVYITKEQALVEIDFNYANCALITNCFPKNNNQTKKEIFNYFIMECNLKRNEEIEKALRKVKREDILEIFDKIELYSKISNKLNDDKPISKKLKI